MSYDWLSRIHELPTSLAATGIGGWGAESLLELSAPSWLSSAQEVMPGEDVVAEAEAEADSASVPAASASAAEDCRCGGGGREDNNSSALPFPPLPSPPPPSP